MDAPSRETTMLATELPLAVASVFETMLGLRVAPTDSVRPPEGPVLARVRFTGIWSGSLTLEAGPPLACLWTSRFLAVDLPDAIDDDVRDVLGELANIIGGNVKSAFGPGITLSTPEILDSGDLLSTSSSDIHAFSCEGTPFRILLQSAQPPK